MVGWNANLGLRNQNQNAHPRPPKEIEHESDRFTTVICQSELQRVMLEGTGRILIAALGLEAARYVERFVRLRDEVRHRVVIRNGYTEPRTLQSGLGALPVRAQRVNDRREGGPFHQPGPAAVLAAHANAGEPDSGPVPKGRIDVGDGEGLAPLLGANAAGLSAASIVRLIEGWQQEYEAWRPDGLVQTLIG